MARKGFFRNVKGFGDLRKDLGQDPGSCFTIDIGPVRNIMQKNFN